MKKTITIKGLTIGEGTPKICTPMVGRSVSELIDEAIHIKTIDADIVEWRVDFFDEVEDFSKVKEALEEIRGILPNVPLIFTFRSEREGGEKELSNQTYLELNKAAVETRLVDIIDVELLYNEGIIKSLIEAAHLNGVFVIISNHDFEKTPSKEEIVSRLRKAQELGGDIPKIAVMPKSTSDVLTLLDATCSMYEHYADRPIITMSMAGQGVISRIAGEVFGSAITFGAAKKASAPGQVPVNDLRKVLEILQSNL
ncbi:type I 3-dehydroquinate dehydratase [Neobacillus sp. NRS-1170]|uniref:type I 3-dehydroquinate dehydratase n=1 Tax=Neobacillus sp. NRS-1170 TaxID=3233898 RepID=UPI003D2E0D9C